MLSMNFGKLTPGGGVHWIVSKLSNSYLIRDQAYQDKLLFDKTACSIGILDFQGNDFGTYILEVDFIGKKEERYVVQVLPIGKKSVMEIQI